MTRQRAPFRRSLLLVLGLTMWSSIGCPGVPSTPRKPSVDTSKPAPEVVQKAVEAGDSVLALQYADKALAAVAAKPTSNAQAFEKAKTYFYVGMAHVNAGLFEEGSAKLSLGLQVAPPASDPTAAGLRKALYEKRGIAESLRGNFGKAAQLFSGMASEAAARKDQGTERAGRLFQWRAHYLANQPAGMQKAEAALRSKFGDQDQFVRLLELEKRRRAPAHAVALLGSSKKCTVLVDPQGRPLTKPFDGGEPYLASVSDFAIFKRDGKFGLRDGKLRTRILPVFHKLEWAGAERRRLVARMEPSRNSRRYALLRPDGTAVIPFGGWWQIQNAQSGISWASRSVPDPNRKPGDKPKNITETRFFRNEDGREVSKGEAEAALRDWQHRASEVRPYRKASWSRPVPGKPGETQKHKTIYGLVDRAGDRVFPRFADEARWASYQRVLWVRDGVVAYEFKATKQQTRQGLWDLRTGKPLDPPSGSCWKVHPFEEGVAACGMNIHDYGLLARDGSWVLEPGPSLQYSTMLGDPTYPSNEALPVKDKGGVLHLKRNGKGWYSQRYERVYPFQGDLAQAFQRVPDEVADRGFNRKLATTGTLIDRKGVPRWAPGRVRLLDNELSLLLPESWSLDRYDMGLAILRMKKTSAYSGARLKGVAYYGHDALAIAQVRGRDQGKDSAQMLKVMNELLQGGAAIPQEDFTANGRSFKVMRSTKAIQGGQQFLFMAALYGSKAYYLGVSGVGTSAVKIKERFESFVRDARFPGDAEF